MDDQLESLRSSMAAAGYDMKKMSESSPPPPSTQEKLVTVTVELNAGEIEWLQVHGRLYVTRFLRLNGASIEVSRV